MSTPATIIATLHAPPADGGAGNLGEHADWIEWRADLLGDGVPEGLRARGAKLLYSLRSAHEGGHSPTERDVRERPGCGPRRSVSISSNWRGNAIWITPSSRRSRHTGG